MVANFSGQTSLEGEPAGVWPACRMVLSADQCLLSHLFNYLVALAVLDKLIVAARLFESHESKKQNQQHHSHDRDVVGLGKDVQELLQPGDVFHRIPVPVKREI
jgi:hypothetical protein